MSASWIGKRTMPAIVLGMGTAVLSWAASAQEPATADQSPPGQEAPTPDTPAIPQPADVAAAAAAGDATTTAPATVATIPVATSDASAQPPASDSTQLDEVVVTARKREESIQEVPLSVTALSSQDMERRGINGLEDIARATPGFTFEPYMTGGAHGAPVIRGLAQTFTTARIQNVSFFLDGVYLQRQSMLDLGMIDLERVEVMKGPQNALYGRNAFAGAVNYITLEPGGSPEGYIMAGTGDNSRQDYRVSLTGPLNESGSILGKITAGFGEYQGGTANHHPVANADPPGPNLRGNLGGYDNGTYTVSLVYTPYDELRVRGSLYRSDIEHETSPGYSISGVHAARFDLRLDNQNDLNCLTATVPDIGNPSSSHTGYSAWCGQLPKYASDVTPRKVAGMDVDPRAIGTITHTALITIATDYTLTPDISVHYLLGHANHRSYTDGGASDEDPAYGRGILADSTKSNQDPTAYYYANTASGRPNSELRELSHELRFDWKFSDRLRTSFGTYLSQVRDQEWTTLFISDLCNADTEANVDHCNQAIATPNHFDQYLRQNNLKTAAPAYDQMTRQHGGRLRGEWTAFHDSIEAVFASGTWSFSDTLQGTLEARYSIEDKAIDRYTDAFMLAPGQSITYDPAQYPVLPIANTLTSEIVVPHDSKRFSDIAPRAIVNWDWAKDHMAYFSIAKGVKAGGFNNSSTPSEQRYEQETNWTYELGSKNSFLHHFFTANAAIYFINWNNLQGSTPPTNASLSSSDVVTNIGGAKSIGIEFEGIAHLSQALSLDLALSHTNPTYNSGVIYEAAAPNPNGTSQKIFCDGVHCRANGEVGGNQLARTSKEQAAFGVNYVSYVANWMLTGRLDANYQSKQFIEPTNLAWVPSRLVSNASLKVNFPDVHWELDTWCKNLTNLDYPSNAFYIGVFDQYMVGKGAPRTLGATLKYKF